MGMWFDAEIRHDPVLDQLQQRKRGAMMFDHVMLVNMTVGAASIRVMHNRV